MAVDTKKKDGPKARLKSEATGLLGALAQRAISSLGEQAKGATGRLTDYVEGGGGPGLMAAVTGAKGMAEGKGPVRSLLGAGWAGAKEKVKGLFGRGKRSGRQKLKFSNIVESIDVGVPIRVAYNQWTQYKDFPTFTKKVENAEQQPDDPKVNDEPKVNWKAQVWWSHRTWESTIIDQHPDEKIVWRSKGQKGHPDGAVTFHELAPNLTRILLVIEYHPQGLFERTGNLWRAQGRRARLELKHFRRHVMAHLLDPNEVEGWRGVIEDSKVVKDHETVLEEEEEARQQANGEVKDETAAASHGTGETAGEERPEEERPEEERVGSGTRGEDTRDEDEGEEEEEKAADDTEVAAASGDGGTGGGRSAGRRRATVGASTGGRRPAATRGSRADDRTEGDRPERGARRGATRGGGAK
jgi:uncharacterized membrane protein